MQGVLVKSEERDIQENTPADEESDKETEIPIGNKLGKGAI